MHLVSFVTVHAMVQALVSFVTRKYQNHPWRYSTRIIRDGAILESAWRCSTRITRDGTALVSTVVNPTFLHCHPKHLLIFDFQYCWLISDFYIPNVCAVVGTFNRSTFIWLILGLLLAKKTEARRRRRFSAECSCAGVEQVNVCKM